jgi:hypothetical protein
VSSDPAAGPQRVTWIYSLSHADLRRLVPRLVAPAEAALEPACITVSYPDGRGLRVELDAETERRLGSFRLKSTAFTFVFDGWTAEQISAFLAHCTRGLQQGGG